MQQEHQSQTILRSPAFCAMLCHGVLCIFLTTPRSYAAVAFSCGHDEKFLRYRKLATSYSLELRHEVEAGLNVVERWNEANDFFCYGRQGIFATNNREQQEITTLALQLLQNCLMLINTLLVEKTLEQHQLLSQLTDADHRALTPLFYEHVNPYGLFTLDLDRPSLLEAT